MNDRFWERFWTKVDKNGPVPTHRPKLGKCWVWTGGRTAAGYGETFYIGKVSYVHRISLERKLGRLLAKGEKSCHSCDNPPCLRPTHLFVGTHTENMRDMLAKGRGMANEKRARGDRNGRRTHPERYPKGDRHPLRLHPELAARGEQQPQSKLTESDVREIRSRWAKGGVKQADIARRFGISQAKVSQIVLRKSWAHVP